MPEQARFAIHFAVFIGCYALIYGVAHFVRRIKKGSPSWEQRTRAQRRVLSLLPGMIVRVSIYAVCIFLLPV